jgi:mono/diheme cytochrome c family protein
MRKDAMSKVSFLKAGVPALLLTLAAVPARADEQPIELKAAPGKEVVEGACAACHSLDYIQMNSPFLDSKKWEATVAKMIKTFGAPITDDDAKKIVAYLSNNYGS